MSDPLPNTRIITADELHELIPLSSMQIWRLERADQFPKRIQLSAKRVGWFLTEVTDWIASRNRGANPDARPSRRVNARAQEQASNED